MSFKTLILKSYFHKSIDDYESERPYFLALSFLTKLGKVFALRENHLGLSWNSIYKWEIFIPNKLIQCVIHPYSHTHHFEVKPKFLLMWIQKEVKIKFGVDSKYVSKEESG